MSERIAAAWALLPEYLGWHVLLSAAALALGLAISLPLAIAASRSPRLRWPLLAAASLIQTIPSLALLALFYPLLLALSAASAKLSRCANIPRQVKDAIVYEAAALSSASQSAEPATLPCGPACGC